MTKIPKTEDLILSQARGSWSEFFAAIDNAGLPDDFLADRDQGTPEKREEL